MALDCSFAAFTKTLLQPSRPTLGKSIGRIVFTCANTMHRRYFYI